MIHFPDVSRLRWLLVAGLVAITSVGCGRPDESDICGQACACEGGCSDAEVDACTVDYAAERERYEEADCDYDSYVACFHDSAVCPSTGVAGSVLCQQKLDDSCERAVR